MSGTESNSKPTSNPSDETLVIFGALGRIGRHLIPAALEKGYKVIAVVRRPEAMGNEFSEEVLNQISVRQADSLNPEQVGRAMEGANIAINASGNVNMGKTFEAIVQIFVEQAEVKLSGTKRAWCFAGLAVLNFPNSKHKATDLRPLNKKFSSHAINFDRLRQSSLDWTLVCPGPIKESANNINNTNTNLRIAVDEMPIDFNASWTRLPKMLWLLPFLSSLPQTTITYEDVANFIVSNLSNSDLSHRRVGIGLPPGTADSKGMFAEVGNRLVSNFRR